MDADTVQQEWVIVKHRGLRLARSISLKTIEIHSDITHTLGSLSSF